MTTSSLNNRKLQYLPALLVVAYGCWLASSRIFSGFSNWDDEGYMIMSLLQYVKHGGLYTKTFTEYGPFYFYLQQTLHSLLHLPVSHDGGRILTLIYWIASSAIAGFVTYRLTRQPLLSSISFLATVLMAMVLTHEPGHPDDVVLFFTECGLALASLAQSKRRSWVLFLIGVVGAFLALTKINIGIFFIAAVYFSCVSLMPRGALRNILFFVGAVPAVLMPLMLMRLYLWVWAKHYCELATMSIVLVLGTAWRVEMEDPWQPGNLLSVFGGMFAGAALVLSIAFAQGLSSSSLLDGIILLALRHPAVMYLPLYVAARNMIIAGLLWLVMAASWNFQSQLERYSNLVGFSKIVSGLVLVLTLVLRIKVGMIFTLPLLPLLYWRTRGHPLAIPKNRLADLFPRLFLCAIITFQFLQAYPVAGDQLFIALTPAAIWACVLISDGFRDVTGYSGLPFDKTVSRLKKPAFVSVSMILFTGAILVEARSYSNFRDNGPALQFPGANHIHVNRRDAQTYSQLVSRIRQHCNVLFTMPGMSSLNLWSDVAPPNGMNLTAWMTAFTEDEQDEIVQILRRRSHPCVVYNSHLLRLWMPAGLASLKESPIARYLQEEMQPIARVSDYELRIPKR